MLHESEHADLAVTQVWARMLDAGIYLCSIATMYRILRDAQGVLQVEVATATAR